MTPKFWTAVFPGQGSQHPGMGKEIYENFKVAQRVYEEASESLKLDLKHLCFESAESELKLTSNTQPALLVTSVAMWSVLISESGLQPKQAMGHSLGEYSALVAAEALTLNDAIVTVRIRGQAMQDAVPVGTGSMYAILGLQDDEVARACLDMQKKAQTSGGLHHCIIEAANFNCPGQVVISGHEKALEYFKTHFIANDYGATRVKLIPLSVSAPFHCSLMKPAAEKMKVQLSKINWAEALKFPVIHNVNSEKNSSGAICKNLLYDQMTRPVLWTSSIRHAKNEDPDSPTNFVEIGAGRILTGLIRKTDPQAHTYSVDTLENLKTTMNDLSL